MTLDEMVAAASAEGWHIRPPTLKRCPIWADGELVGFFCPHPAGRGRKRVGPIYVLPQYRGRGLAQQAYAWADGVPLVAYVHSNNVASERFHERAGFRRWYQTNGGWYWKRG
jgi:RimJ/RimL family protein N-acetyltransferase